VSPRFELIEVTEACGEELQRLAFELADSAARADIECIALPVGDDMDTQNLPLSKHREDNEDNRMYVDRALRYLDLRGSATIDFTFVRDRDQPHLVRFEAKP
jgi:hypothetical protein